MDGKKTKKNKGIISVSQNRDSILEGGRVRGNLKLGNGDNLVLNNFSLNCIICFTAFSTLTLYPAKMFILKKICTENTGSFSIRQDRGDIL